MHKFTKQKLKFEAQLRVSSIRHKNINISQYGQYWSLAARTFKFCRAVHLSIAQCHSKIKKKNKEIFQVNFSFSFSAID